MDCFLSRLAKDLMWVCLMPECWFLSYAWWVPGVSNLTEKATKKGVISCLQPHGASHLACFFSFFSHEMPWVFVEGCIYLDIKLAFLGLSLTWASSSRYPTRTPSQRHQRHRLTIVLKISFGPAILEMSSQKRPTLPPIIMGQRKMALL